MCSRRGTDGPAHGRSQALPRPLGGQAGTPIACPPRNIGLAPDALPALRSMAPRVRHRCARKAPAPLRRRLHAFAFDLRGALARVMRQRATGTLPTRSLAAASGHAKRATGTFRSPRLSRARSVHAHLQTTVPHAGACYTVYACKMWESSYTTFHLAPRLDASGEGKSACCRFPKGMPAVPTPRLLRSSVWRAGGRCCPRRACCAPVQAAPRDRPISSGGHRSTPNEGPEGNGSHGARQRKQAAAAPPVPHAHRR